MTLNSSRSPNATSPRRPIATLTSKSKSTSTTSTTTPVSHYASPRTQLIQFGAGALAGFVNTLILSPLDVVKTRLQVQGATSSSTSPFAAKKYRGLLHALQCMLREEGFRSYYRGLSASLCAFVPNWAIYWYTYESFKRFYSPPGKPPSPYVHVISALSAGGITAVTTAPFWTLKSRLQVDVASVVSERRYKSVPHGFRKIIREEGVSALYKGLTPTLLGLGHVAIQFPLYEHLKASFSSDSSKHLKATHVLVASSISKIAASAIFYPHEVLRTRIQIDTTIAHHGVRPMRLASLVRQILSTEGPKGFYRGFATNLLRTVPACMLTFTSYELVKRYAEQQALKNDNLTLDSQLENAVLKKPNR